MTSKAAATFVPETDSDDDEVPVSSTQPTCVQRSIVSDAVATTGNAETESSMASNDSDMRLVGDEWVTKDPVSSLFQHYSDNAWVAVPDEKQNEIKENGQWLPDTDVNEDFLAAYQLNYGVAYDYDSMKKLEPVKKSEDEETKEEKEKKEAAKRAGQPPGWHDMDETKLCAVYVSNMPPDITEEEFAELMSKCGVIQLDARTNTPKIKLYRDEEGRVKGDGRCVYIKKESVELALQILDGWKLRDKEISVEQAHFEMKGDFDPSKKKRRLTAAQKKRFLEQQNRIFEWRPEKPRNYRPHSDCVVVLKNLFTLDQMQKNAALMMDLKEEVQTSCKKFGNVKKVVVYDNNPEGVVTVTFEKTDESDTCVKMMNGRIVDGKKLTAQLWDGKTKYLVAETEEEREKRLSNWEKFIENEEKEEEDEAEEQKTT